MKANHNRYRKGYLHHHAVSNGSKILKWKQITTHRNSNVRHSSCFQWIKDTKMKANHNIRPHNLPQTKAVSNGSKILKWKQITTERLLDLLGYRCFQWIKDTKMKANHNKSDRITFAFGAVSNGSKILKWKQITTIPKDEIYSMRLFPMDQRY